MTFHCWSIKSNIYTHLLLNTSFIHLGMQASMQAVSSLLAAFKHYIQREDSDKNMHNISTRRGLCPGLLSDFALFFSLVWQSIMPVFFSVSGVQWISCISCIILIIQVVPPDFCRFSKFQALAMDSSFRRWAKQRLGNKGDQISTSLNDIV
jgi:hypothetical protein